MFPYKWNLKDLNVSESTPLKVFSTFACGGGSTMGYKLAGYQVIGANDIDPKMAKVYKHNHKPKYYFLCPIGELLSKELPKELYNLDILDGSPPCSTFSQAGQREKGYKKEKRFKEGQAKQVLSDLFFDWINLVEKLQPKVAIAENVKGMLMTSAIPYVKRVVKRLNEIGYDVQLFSLNAASMGVPQKRERVFFICKRKDLRLPKLKLSFNYPTIPFSRVSDNQDQDISETTETYLKYWKQAKEGEPVGKFNSIRKIKYNEPCNTINASNGLFHPKIPRVLNKKELCLIGTFPLDYDFLDINPMYLIGMSVPPVCIAHIARQIKLQLLNN